MPKSIGRDAGRQQLARTRVERRRTDTRRRRQQRMERHLRGARRRHAPSREEASGRVSRERRGSRFASGQYSSCLMGELRNAGTEVERRDAGRGEARHVGPALLARASAAGSDRRTPAPPGRSRTRRRAGALIHDLAPRTRQAPANAAGVSACSSGAIGREAMVEIGDAARSGTTLRALPDSERRDLQRLAVLDALNGAWATPGNA